MIVAELVGLCVLVALSLALNYSTHTYFKRRLDEQDKAEEGRRLALYKQQKATQRTTAQSDRAVRKLADETRHLKDEAELALRRIDRHISDQKRGMV